MNLPRTTYLVILTGAFLWCSAIVVAPYLASTSSWLADFVYRFFHTVCHQAAERSFHLDDKPFGVCSRCSSIYFAFLTGTLLYPLLQRRILSVFRRFTHPRTVVFLIVLPMILDVAGEYLGTHDSTFLTRTITGALFGLVIPFIILPAAIEGVQEIAAKRPVSPTIIDN